MKKKSLIIVESPAKIKTLRKFLGEDYLFESSVGHIRDLPEKEFGIDLEHDFEPKYVTMPDKEKVIDNLRKAAKKSDIVYLSPDPDREGEAIAWHITQILPEGTKFKRVSFNSITKDEVVRALHEPREIDMPLVNAQQARRLLDRIVGYKISPILNRRIQRGRDGFVSAGRVQSVALKLVVMREKEIEAFKPVEYWNLAAMLDTKENAKVFRANLYSVDSKKVEKEPVEGKDVTLIGNQVTALEILERMRKEPYKVAAVERKEKRRNPPPPFITSTLQQEASRHYGFSSAKTMSVSQQLYEGLDLGNEGTEGLITYMRTDSTRIAPEALDAARGFINKVYGKDYLPDQARIFAGKKSAQDAHEAIRPANLKHPPESVEKYLTREQFMLYKLIWQRFIAGQMNPAVYDTVSADIEGQDGILLRATGSVIKFQGYLAVYEEKQDEVEEDEDSKMLPDLKEGDTLKLIDLVSEQAFTRPPPRYTEASLVKELEKSGIGRPSTYAAIMNKIQSRDYTVKEKGRLKPTELGRVICEMLDISFQKIMDIGFTAQMEDNLESIADNQSDWKELIRAFWTDFEPTLQTAEKEAFVPKVTTDIECPECKGKLQKIWYKSKYFYGCENYPDCNYSAPIEEVHFDEELYADDFDWKQPCPNCGSKMKVRHGKFGAFLGCSTYPECKGIVNIPKKGETVISQEDMPACPANGCPGHMVARKSRYGKTFYSCSTFPECDVIVNDLEQLPTKYADHPRTAYTKVNKKGAAKGKKTSGTKKKKATTTKKRALPSSKLSDEMAKFLGTAEASRGEVVKKVWDYIKEKNLQDPKNKKIICPDATLGKLLGAKEPFDMFKIAGLISGHMKKS